MRPPRLLLLLVCFIALPIILTFLSLLSAHPRDADSLATGYDPKSNRLRALFSFHTPASLFPPSAIISLTDDNSTFFLARPAAFGPALPSNGLSSQLWVGSGFGDDSIRKTGSAFSAEGELGCSDVPGWGESDKKQTTQTASKAQHQAAPGTKSDKDAVAGKVDGGKLKRTSDQDGAVDLVQNQLNPDSPSENDGTDDHLHHPLPESNPAEAAKPGQPAEHEATKGKSKTPTHADIQSLQESAEIAGKVVLLSRGGCGFLEKVKWVQRRGGVALIVGDDARGGPLITMYARGDTSNVTIPAVFTSHTTAHLLSSLIPPETTDEQGTEGSKDNKGKKPKQKSKLEDDGPTFTAKAATQPTTRPAISTTDTTVGQPGDGAKLTTRSWLGSILSIFGLKGGSYYPWHVGEDSRRPPSSGNIDWVWLEDWDEKKSSPKPTSAPQNPTSNGRSGKGASGLRKSKPSSKSGDDFVIGIQDWRDPDVLTPADKQENSQTKPGDLSSEMGNTKSSGSNKGPTAKMGDSGTLKGGSITPGSGEYGDGITSTNKKAGTRPAQQASPGSPVSDHADDARQGWLSRLLWGTTSGQPTAEPPAVPAKSNKIPGKVPSPNAPPAKVQSGTSQTNEEHEGLWVTLTPATMSASPFFDTLLVLVVSPLVTLTVVYALLLLRSRIRRRRWRAPKSVVERLPVRVYHTMSSSSSTTSSQISSPRASSPTSPLLRSASRSIPPRNRPRSQTTSGVLAGAESSNDRFATSATPPKEKAPSAPVWKKRYTGRQVECVVCLEEYIDGQSRVMSLPCGHEFHADCITPWLVRRRRTCPICKGDVVRSMAQGGSNERRQEGENSSDDIQARAAETVNESPSAAIPIPHLSDEDDEDIERGAEASAPPNGGSDAPRSAWRNLTSLSFSALSGNTAVWRSSPTDRNR